MALFIVIMCLVVPIFLFTPWVLTPRSALMRRLVGLNAKTGNSCFRGKIKEHQIKLRPEDNVIIIKAPEPYPGRFVLRPMGLFGEPQPDWAAEMTPRETGDHLFDGCFNVWGDAPVVGILDWWARAELMRLGGNGGGSDTMTRIYERQTGASLPAKIESADDRRNRLPLVRIEGDTIILQWQRRARQLGDWVEFSRRLLREGTVVEHLLENCKEGGDVRTYNLRILAQELVAHHEILRTRYESQLREQLQTATRLEDQLLIYRIIGSEAEPWLRDAVEREDTEGHEALIVEIAHDLAAQNKRDFLEQLASRPGRIGDLALKSLATFADEAARDTILQVYEDTFAITVQVSAIEAMGLMGDTADRTFLVNLLDDLSPEVKIAAAAALGACGDVSVIEPMSLKLEMAREPFRHVLKESIHRIQEGLGDVEAGWLSVRESRKAEGALSLGEAVNPEGMLSVKDDES